MSDDDHIIYTGGNMLTGNFKHSAMSAVNRMLRLHCLKHIVQVYIVARCGLNFVIVGETGAR